MEEKIKETKIAILDRIKKAVVDDSKSISPESLKIMAEIVNDFDNFELDTKNSEKDYSCIFEKMINSMKMNELKHNEIVVEEGV